MKDKDIALWSFIDAISVAGYVAAVSSIIRNGERIFGKMDNFLGPVAFLLLFVLSAAITGALILGRPVMLFLGGQKKEAVKLFIFSVGWLLAIIIVVFVAQIFR